MAGLDNLNSSPMRRMAARTRSLETTPAATNTAIGRDGMEVYDGGVIDITNGGLNVTGTATISGTLTGSGDFTWSGTVDITGNVTTTGQLNVDGPMKTTDTLSVEGVTTLKNDLNVTTGGKITAGNTVIDPSASNGGVTFVSGGGVGGSGGAVALRGSSNAGVLADTIASLFCDANAVTVSSSAITISGVLKNPGMSTTASAANVYYDPSDGRFYYKP